MKEKIPKNIGKITSKELSLLIVEGMQEKKAEDIAILNLEKIKHSCTDKFIICSGNSENQINAISESVVTYLKKHKGVIPWRTEGKENKEWILIDYVDVVVHIFSKETRSFYGLEEMWADAPVITV